MFQQAFKNIDDVLWKEAGCASELNYTEQTSWLPCLKFLDGLEQDKATEAELHGRKYNYILEPANRWDTLATPKDAKGLPDHNAAQTGNDLRDFYLQRNEGVSILQTTSAKSRNSRIVRLSRRCLDNPIPRIELTKDAKLAEHLVKRKALLEAC